MWSTDRIVATARVGADGNATLPLPVPLVAEPGKMWVVWRQPDPSDRYCAYNGLGRIDPNSREVLVEIGKSCT